MPVVKVGDKWEFGGKTYDTEEAANNAYKAYLATKFGTTDPAEDEDKPKKKSSKKKGKKKAKEDDDEGDHEYRD